MYNLLLTNIYIEESAHAETLGTTRMLNVSQAYVYSKVSYRMRYKIICAFLCSSVLPSQSEKTLNFLVVAD